MFKVKVLNLDLKSSIIPQATSEQVIDDANRPSLILNTSAVVSGDNRGVKFDMKNDDDEELKLEAVPSEGNPMMQTPKETT